MTAQRTIILASAKPDPIADLVRHLAGEFEIIITHDAPPDACGGDVICFVDWLLPSQSGAEMCRRLRAHPATVQAMIILLLDDDSEEARAKAMRAGADDYLIAPFCSDTILQRLARHLPTPTPAPAPAPAPLSTQPSTEPQGFEINLAAHRAYWRGEPLDLRPNELKLLAFLLDHSDRLLTRAQLIEMLGKRGANIDPRTVDVWMGRLRKALDAKGAGAALRTVRSRGYVFDTALRTR